MTLIPRGPFLVPRVRDRSVWMGISDDIGRPWKIAASLLLCESVAVLYGGEKISVDWLKTRGRRVEPDSIFLVTIAKKGLLPLIRRVQGLKNLNIFSDTNSKCFKNTQRCQKYNLNKRPSY
jgi:hypothetical protein